ncbi:hypothetical protein U1Q18_045816 [Sarracenia purpurea var. burkii]
MMEELNQRLEAFKLTKEEEADIDISEDDIKITQQECKVSLLGKLITTKTVNLQGLKAAMNIAWGYSKELKILEEPAIGNAFRGSRKKTDEGHEENARDECDTTVRETRKAYA